VPGVNFHVSLKSFILELAQHPPVASWVFFFFHFYSPFIYNTFVRLLQGLVLYGPDDPRVVSWVSIFSFHFDHLFALFIHFIVMMTS